MAKLIAASGEGGWASPQQLGDPPEQLDVPVLGAPVRNLGQETAAGFFCPFVLDRFPRVEGWINSSSVLSHSTLSTSSSTSGPSAVSATKSSTSWRSSMMSPKKPRPASSRASSMASISRSITLTIAVLIGSSEAQIRLEEGAAVHRRGVAGVRAGALRSAVRRGAGRVHAFHDAGHDVAGMLDARWKMYSTPGGGRTVR